MKKRTYPARKLVLVTLALSLLACEHLDDNLRDHTSGKDPLPSYVTLEEVAQILSSVPIGSSQMGEVHDAVTSSTGNGYDEEYTMKDLFETPGAGVGDSPVKASSKTYDTPLRALLTEAVTARYGTKAADGGVSADEFLDALTASDVQIYWPFSDGWDGETSPVITFDPEDNSDKNLGFVAGDDGTLRSVVVDEEMARSRPVWVINRNDDASFQSLEVLRRENPDWGTGGGLISVKADAGGDIRTWVLRSFKANRCYDTWFAGASEFFVRCGAVENFTAATVEDISLYTPSITDFMIVVKRDQIGQEIPFNAVLVSEWTGQLDNVAFMITEDDGGKRTTWHCSTKVTVKSKVFGIDIDLPLKSADDIVWRGQLSRRYVEKYSGKKGTFGDVELALELL
jgi:hypothetical protein